MAKQPVERRSVPKTAIDALRNALPRPADDATREDKKNYAERLSNEVARFVAYRLRELGAKGAVPDEIGGRERRFAGGIGDKKVDVSVASMEHGLILSIGIKSINFPDGKTKNYNKNLTNRRGDLLAEATTLHQRFPYAVVGGLFLFDAGADRDGTPRRLSTFRTAHQLFSAFSSRPTRSDAVEQYEALGVVLYSGVEPFAFRYFDAGDPENEKSLDEFFFRLLNIVAQRNPDTYRFFNNRLQSAAGGNRTTTENLVEALLGLDIGAEDAPDESDAAESDADEDTAEE